MSLEGGRSKVTLTVPCHCPPTRHGHGLITNNACVFDLLVPCKSPLSCFEKLSAKPWTHRSATLAPWTAEATGKNSTNRPAGSVWSSRSVWAPRDCPGPFRSPTVCSCSIAELPTYVNRRLSVAHTYECLATRTHVDHICGKMYFDYNRPAATIIMSVVSELSVI